MMFNPNLPYYYITRHEDISQVKMFNPNLYKNKSYEMNFKHKYMSYMFV